MFSVTTPRSARSECSQASRTKTPITWSICTPSNDSEAVKSRPTSAVTYTSATSQKRPLSSSRKIPLLTISRNQSSKSVNKVTVPPLDVQSIMIPEVPPLSAIHSAKDDGIYVDDSSSVYSIHLSKSKPASARTTSFAVPIYEDSKRVVRNVRTGGFATSRPSSSQVYL